MHWSKLTVWQKTHELTLKIYETFSGFPDEGILLFKFSINP